MVAVHGPPVGPVDPELQVQVVTEVLPEGEFDLEGHARQLVCPVSIPYLPVSQTVHDISVEPPAFSPYLPAGQFLHAACPSPAYFPASQTLQVSVVVVVARNLPAAHGVHGATGAAGLP
jgi:hypothetical protein